MKKASIQLNAVRKLLGLKFDFVDATLADGTAVKVEPSVEEGASVMVITAEGEEIPAPDGEHALADGRVIVTSDGVIIQIIEAPLENAKDDKEDEDKFATLTETVAKLAKTVADLTDRFEKSQAEPRTEPTVSAEEFKAVSERLAKTEADLQAANEVVVKLAEQSKAAPNKPAKKSTPPSGDDVNQLYYKALFNKQ
jgi:hypothetical protein